MSPSDRDRQIEALVARYRKLLEQRWPTGPQTIDQIEQTVEEISQELERELERRILHDQDRSQANSTTCPTCQSPGRYRGTRARTLITSHGECRFRRRYYSCRACGAGFAPLDAVLGLDGAAPTPLVRLWITELAAKLPFEEAAVTLQRLTGVSVSAATVERTAVAIGTALRRSQREEALQHQEGRLAPGSRRPKRLYITIDGKFVPLRDPWKRDGSAGALVCRYGECKLGAVYEARSGPTGDGGVRRVAYTATLADVRAFTPLIGALAHQHGHHFAREVIVLGDGALWIWQLAATQFPDAMQIVDFYHAWEHLTTVAAAQFGEGTPAAKEWVAARVAELKQDKVEQVIAAIGAWAPTSDDGRKLQASEQHYFTTNAERMRYGTYEQKGYHIASGIAESACGHVVGQRLDQAGMHWCPPTAEAIVCLRAALRSSHPTDLRPYCTAVA